MRRRPAVATPLAAAPLAAALLLGGCDGGLFGTGDDENADAAVPVGTAPPASGTDGDDSQDAAFGPVDGAGDGSAAPPASPGEAPAGIGADANGDDDDDDGGGGETADTGTGAVFVNDEPTVDGVDALLRVVNLAPDPVRVGAVDGGAEPFTVPGRGVGAVVALDASVRSLIVSDALASAAPDRVDVRLSSGTLTTLAVYAAAGRGLRAVPLATSAERPAGGVAAVRVLDAPTARGGASPGSFELRPAGSEPGGAAAGFAARAPGSIDSRYERVLPGDYELVRSADAGAGAPLSLAAGLTYSLALDGVDGAPLVIVDSVVASRVR